MYRDEWEGPTTEELLHEELYERAHEKEMERQRTLLELHHFYKDHAPSPTEEPTTRSAPVKKPEPKSDSVTRAVAGFAAVSIMVLAVVAVVGVGVAIVGLQRKQQNNAVVQYSPSQEVEEPVAEPRKKFSWETATETAPINKPRKKFSWETATEPIETSEGLRGRIVSTEKRVIILPVSPTRRQGVVSTPGQP